MTTTNIVTDICVVCRHQHARRTPSNGTPWECAWCGNGLKDHRDHKEYNPASILFAKKRRRAYNGPPLLLAYKVRRAR